MGLGTDDLVAALTCFQGQLIAGGNFGTAGSYTSCYFARWACSYEMGDLNCDGLINAFDIDPFVLALTNPDAYAAQLPGCDYMLADVNGDGSVNAFDINPFVVLLTGG